MNKPQTSKMIMRGLLNRAAILFISLLLAIVAGLIYSSDWEYRFYTSRIEKIIDRKHEILKENIVFLGEDGIDAVSLRSKEHRVKWITCRNKELLSLHILTALWFSGQTIHSMSHLIRLLKWQTMNWFLFRMGILFQKELFLEIQSIIGLLRVYNSFDIENSLLKNGFPNYFRLPLNAGIITPPITIRLQYF
ncbi:MAG: hypothetical protein MZW92_25095 [Comamonadaceae bacterium]|nr:hypothetical protein [Comamonadaceae bacterium]